MVEFMKSLLEMLLRASPILVVFLVFGYIAKNQEKRAKEREAEKKRGVIKKTYIVRTEKILTIIFVAGIFFSMGSTVASARAGETWVPVVFGIASIGFAFGSLNMIMWKLEVNGDEITWRSTFGKKRKFCFEDITYCERKNGSIRVYVNGKKLFTIDSNIDKGEFMEDVKRRRIPVKSYYANQLRNRTMKKK